MCQKLIYICPKLIHRYGSASSMRQTCPRGRLATRPAHLGAADLCARSRLHWGPGET